MEHGAAGESVGFWLGLGVLGGARHSFGGPPLQKFHSATQQ